MPYRPHLVSSTTRPVVRPLVQKVFGDFDPLRLDPYLFFDAATSMVGTLENPTLDLDPATPSTLDVITATRAGIATYTDPDGNIATASADTVRVDYTQGDELTPTVYQHIQYTDFSGLWSTYAYGGGSLTKTSGYASPEGNNDAHKFDIVVGTGGVLFTQNATILSSQPYTMSVWMKGEVGGEKVRIDLKNSQSNGVNGSVFTLTNEWQRYELTRTSDATNRGFHFRITASDNASDQTFYAYGPQLEEGTTASSFVENTTGSPKFTGISATYAPRVPMILVEPSSENLITRSEDFSFSGWTKNGASVANGISSPDGNNTAFKLTEDATGSGHYLQETVTVSSATIYTASIFVKYESREWIRFTDAESINRVHFNTRTGQFGTVVGTVIAYSSTELDDGWHRITITSTSAGTAYSMRIILAESDNDVAYTGDGTSGIYVWGAQLETGSVATSLIPTAGGNAAARTRAADDLVISGSDFSDFYNQSEGTVYVELTSEDDGKNSYPVYFTQDIAGFAERNNGTWAIQKDGTPSFYLASWANGGFVSDALINLGVYTAGDLTRVSVSYNSNSYEGSKDGASVQTSTPTTMATTLVDRLFVGGSGIFQNSSRIKRLIYWPYHSDSL